MPFSPAGHTHEEAEQLVILRLGEPVPVYAIGAGAVSCKRGCKLEPSWGHLCLAYVVDQYHRCRREWRIRMLCNCTHPSVSLTCGWAADARVLAWKVLTGGTVSNRTTQDMRCFYRHD